MGTETFIFEIHNQMYDFVFTPSTDQSIFLDIKTYVKYMNSYGEMKDIDQDSPIKVYIYEDNRKIISQSEVYFTSYINLDVKANIQYSLKIFNNVS